MLAFLFLVQFSLEPERNRFVVVGAAPFLVCRFLLVGEVLLSAVKLLFVGNELGALAATGAGNVGLPVQDFAAGAFLVSLVCLDVEGIDRFPPRFGGKDTRLASLF